MIQQRDVIAEREQEFRQVLQKAVDWYRKELHRRDDPMFADYVNVVLNSMEVFETCGRELQENILDLARLGLAATALEAAKQAGEEADIEA